MSLFDEDIQGGNECENITISSWKIGEKNDWINEEIIPYELLILFCH